MPDATFFFFTERERQREGEREERERERAATCVDYHMGASERGRERECCDMPSVAHALASSASTHALRYEMS